MLQESLRVIVGVVLFIGLLCLLEIRRELRYFKTTHYIVKSSKLQKLDSEKKIIFLSDLHNKIYGEKNEQLLQAIKREEPDFILIGGDMLVAKQGVSYSPALEFVSKLPAICPVYYCNGNHEQRMKKNPSKYESSFFEYKENLCQYGVQFLENESIVEVLGEIKIRITGLELPDKTYQKFGNAALTVKEIQERVGKADMQAYQILLAHHPRYFQTYKEWSADLVLSGHLHGGIIRLPFLGGMITPQARLFPKYSGEMTTDGNHTIIVSKGLGTHTVNLRFLNEAELVVIHLKNTK